jgi:3-deoxy-D-manno-octulosonate 8-phosphate phosphatase (KDO 8-P phosphatase)
VDREIEELCRAVRLIVMDVDGVLTDGSIELTSGGAGLGALPTESKTFNVKDGLAIRWARRVGVETAFLTSRSSGAVERRAEELSVTRLVTGASDKAPALLALCQELGVAPAEVAYLGDDLPDLAPMRLAGLAIAVADAAPEVREVAHWVTDAPGGRGAAREAIEAILRTQGRWQRVVDHHMTEEPDEWRD